MGGFTKFKVPEQSKVRATLSQFETVLFIDCIIQEQFGSLKLDELNVQLESSVKYPITLQFGVPSPKISLIV